MYKQRKRRLRRVRVDEIVTDRVYRRPVGPPHCVTSASGTRPEVAVVGAEGVGRVFE